MIERVVCESRNIQRNNHCFILFQLVFVVIFGWLCEDMLFLVPQSCVLFFFSGECMAV